MRPSRNGYQGPSAPDHSAAPLDLAFILLTVLVLGVSLALPAEALPAVVLCPFRATTGLPCPGCGLTHAFCAIGHGDFVQAWAYNPFGFAFYAGALGLLAWPVLRRRCPSLLSRAVASPWFVRGPVALVAAMWVFGLWRMWSVWAG